MNIKKEHLDYLQSSAMNHNSWLGISPKSWYEWIKNSTPTNAYMPNLSELEHSKINRSQLKEIANDSSVDTLSCCISILAWGGMNRQHGATALSSAEQWIPIADKIRSGYLSRIEAYDQFKIIREKGYLNGMGPAYFTKLIFFLMPKNSSKGYIMDQWTSASINLLFEKKIIQTSLHKARQKDGSIKIYEIVSDTNTKDTYESYCQAVEYISEILKSTPEITEEMMFSEGRGKGKWRNYVIEQRSLLS